MTCNSCGVENSNDEKICTKCGKRIVPIKWINTNLVKIKHKWWWYVINVLAGIVIVVLSFALGFFIIGMVLDEGNHAFTDEDLYYLSVIVLSDVGFFLFLYSRIVFNSTRKLRRVADAIADNSYNERLLVKDGKYGLFHWKYKMVILPVIYDNIYRHETFYYTVKYENKYGIYKIYNEIFYELIVPIEYDAVTPFVNGVATITKDNVTKQVDKYGKIL